MNAITPEDARSQLVSTYLVVCYAAISLPVVGVALVSRAAGSTVADTAFGAVNLLLASAALIIEVRRAAR